MKKFYKVNICITPDFPGMIQTSYVSSVMEFEKYYLNDENNIEIVRKQAILDYINYYKENLRIYPEELERYKDTNGETEKVLGNSTRIGFVIQFGNYQDRILLVDVLEFNIDTSKDTLYVGDDDR